jgi:L-methionine (R)-S-oxide reductase
MSEETLVAAKTPGETLNAAEKAERYELITSQIESVIADEPDLLACMTVVVCLLHNAFPHYFWTGFYRRVGPGELLVGPYQGTLGCLRIEFGRGVCGTAASELRSVLVPDVSAFPGHIACDAASASEIVVPVLDARGELIAVFDVDSDRIEAFDAVDQEWLERIVALLRDKSAEPVVLGSTRAKV